MPTILGKEVGPYALGLMGLTWRPDQTPDDQAFAALKAALESGCNFWNGGEFYGPPESNSLHLLNRYFTKYPEDADKVILCIKGANDLQNLDPHGDAAFVSASLENCLRILAGKKKIDIFECARVDKTVPIEETIGALAKFVAAGKIGGIGLSECSAASIERAVKVHPITSVEVEVSLWADMILHNGVADSCARHNIPLVAYSPLGRGFLTGQIKSRADLPKGDFRLLFPHFSEENFPKNLTLVEKVEQIAAKKGCTPAQLALAWVKNLQNGQGRPTVIPLPGATTAARVKENMTLVTLDADDLAAIDEALSSFELSGTRYPDFLVDQLDG